LVALLVLRLTMSAPVMDVIKIPRMTVLIRISTSVKPLSSRIRAGQRI
jgi:hypothetical protein